MRPLLKFSRGGGGGLQKWNLLQKWSKLIKKVSSRYLDLNPWNSLYKIVKMVFVLAHLLDTFHGYIISLSFYVPFVLCDGAQMKNEIFMTNVTARFLSMWQCGACWHTKNLYDCLRRKSKKSFIQTTLFVSFHFVRFLTLLI